MNWKNVLFILRVERKSGRLLRGIKATRYRENGFLAYWPYWVALGISVPVGALLGWSLSGASTAGLSGLTTSIPNEAVKVFVTLPTIVLIFSIVFTLFQQIQVAGQKPSGQVMYALPITWEEHTLASVLANLLGFPIAVVLGFAGGAIAFAAFNGVVLQALLSAVMMFASAFLASSLTEILRVLQVRFSGAVYKSSGVAAVWVRFISSILLLVVLYVVYLYFTNGFISFVSNLSTVQSVAWFVPFVWPALMVSYLTQGLYSLGLVFMALSAALIAGVYYLAVECNRLFGLYEPPAITIQKAGFYAPKTGLLGRLGFSSVEAALIRKDLKAFTRRRELLGVYIFPIVIVIVALFNSFGVTNSGSSSGGPNLSVLWEGLIFLVPSGIAMWLGQVMIGEEGQTVWRIYASPISPKSLVKSKYFFTVLFSVIVLFASSAIGIGFLHPSLRRVVVAMLEAFFISIAAAAISLQVGFRGADFSQTRRQRMIRQEWSLLGFVEVMFAGVGIFAPVLVPYGLALLSGSTVSSLNLAVEVAISAVISVAITAVFYRINIASAKDLLRKAEV